MRAKEWTPLLALVAGWAAATAVVATLVANGHGVALERAQRSSAALAQIMEQHTARSFQAVTLTLGALADTWQLTRPGKHDAAFQSLLLRRLQHLPHVRSLFVIGTDGFLIHDTGYPDTPGVSLADRGYFAVHRDDPSLEHSVSGPLLSRRSPRAGWFISVTGRLGRGAEFEGIVAASVLPAHFEALYGKMALGEGDVIALLHRDGTLIARYPAAGDEVGRRFTVPGKRLVSTRAVEDLPLVVHVSRSEHEALAEWRRSAVGAAVAMGALTLLLAGVLVQQLRARKRRQQERAQRAQAEKLEALGQLTGGIAHDFGNLLHVVRLNLRVIEDNPGDRESAARACAVAGRALRRGAEQVARLLAFARRQPLELQAADLNSLLTEAHTFIAQAAGSRTEIVMQLAPSLPPVLTDVAQFEIALLNLVVNARDAMPGGGRIVLRTYAAPGGEACLAVEDEGSGMSAQVRRRAMEPFFTTKGKEGTGLGLAQVYGFMQQAGGDLRIESASGKGTRVHLRFARAAALTGVNQRG